jgi:ABC-type nickel/cobalt efflux system permease component RcnA
MQTIAALVLVALAATWLIRRAIRKRRQPGCGDDCACPASEVKDAADRTRRP